MRNKLLNQVAIKAVVYIHPQEVQNCELFILHPSCIEINLLVSGSSCVKNKTN